MDLARVFVLELDEAAAAAAVAQAFPFGETHLVERLRPPERLSLLVFRRQILRPVGARERSRARASASFNTKLGSIHKPMSDVMANGLSSAGARECGSISGERKSPSQDVKSGPRSSSPTPPASAHDMGEGHPERPDRLRAIERALESEAFQMLARDAAPRADLAAIARVHPQDYIEAIRAAAPKQGLAALDAGHVDVAGHLRGRAARRGRRGLRGRRGDERQGPQRLRRDPPARPSRRSRDPDGLLLLQQRGDRRAPRAGRARRRAGRDHGFRRPSRQRHPAHLLGRSDRHLRLDPQMPHYPGTGAVASAASTTRSSTRPCGRATAAKRSARRWRPRSCRASRRSRPISSSSRRASTPIGAIRSATSTGRSRLRLGDAEADGDRAQARP